MAMDVVVERHPEVEHAAREDGVVLSVVGGRVFCRNAIKLRRDGSREHVRVMVGELDGVRVYVHGDSVILTREDLYF